MPNISGNTVHKKRIPSDEQSDAFIQRKNKCLVLISSKSIGNRGERCVCLSAHAHSAATTPFMVNFVSYATLRICFKILCSLYIRSKQATTYRTMHLIHYFKNSWFRVRFEQASTRMQPASIIHRKKNTSVIFHLYVLFVRASKGELLFCLVFSSFQISHELFMAPQLFLLFELSTNHEISFLISTLFTFAKNCYLLCTNLLFTRTLLHSIL